jgi:hypothetical protein
LVTLVFARQMSEPLTSLVKRIDEAVSAAGKQPRPLGAFAILLDKADGLDAQLRATAESQGLKHVFLGIGVPPKDYEVSSDADVTVVVYSVERRRQQKVTANFAFRKGELDAAKIAAIEQAVTAVMPK